MDLRRLKEFWRAATTPRMLGLFVLLLAAALVCVRLGAWQLDRATSRGAAEVVAEHEAVLARATVPLEEVLPPQTSFPADALAVPVEVTGTYRADEQVYVPGREVDGEPAVLVVTALEVGAGPHAGAMIPVLRGWVDPSAVDLGGDVARPAAGAEELLRAPAGERHVTGYLKDAEAAVEVGGPAGVVGSVSTAQLASLWGGPTWSGYLVEFTTTADGSRSDVAPDGLRHAPPPGAAEQTGLNLQNVFYAIEWVVFGGFALVVWWRTVRDEVARRREDAALAAGAAPVAEGGVDDGVRPGVDAADDGAERASSGHARHG